jgi:hypothetical protein
LPHCLTEVFGGETKEKSRAAAEEEEGLAASLKEPELESTLGCGGPERRGGASVCEIQWPCPWNHSNHVPEVYISGKIMKVGH